MRAQAALKKYLERLTVSSLFYVFIRAIAQLAFKRKSCFFSIPCAVACALVIFCAIAQLDRQTKDHFIKGRITAPQPDLRLELILGCTTPI